MSLNKREAAIVLNVLRASLRAQVVRQGQDPRVVDQVLEAQARAAGIPFELLRKVGREVYEWSHAVNVGGWLGAVYRQ